MSKERLYAEIKEKIHYYLGSDSLSDCWGEVLPLLEALAAAAPVEMSELYKSDISNPVAPEPPQDRWNAALEAAAKYVESINHDVFSLQNIANGIRKLRSIEPAPRFPTIEDVRKQSASQVHSFPKAEPAPQEPQLGERESKPSAAFDWWWRSNPSNFQQVTTLDGQLILAWHAWSAALYLHERAAQQQAAPSEEKGK